MTILFPSFESVLIRPMTDSDLENFLLYKSTLLVSPYKSEEKLKSSPLENYMPVKIKVLGGARVQLKKIDLDEMLGTKLI